MLMWFKKVYNLLTRKKPVYVIAYYGSLHKQYYSDIAWGSYYVKDIGVASKFKTFDEAAKALDTIVNEYNVIYLNIETYYNN